MGNHKRHCRGGEVFYRTYTVLYRPPAHTRPLPFPTSGIIAYQWSSNEVALVRRERSQLSALSSPSTTLFQSYQFASHLNL